MTPCPATTLRKIRLIARHGWLVAATLWFANFAAATEPTDLGQGLSYLRVQSLQKSAQALTAALLRPNPLVLDLRYTADEPEAALALRALNSQPAKPRVYVLVSPDTPASLSEVLATSNTPLITLGVKGSRPAAQVVIDQSVADDRRAYDALDAGTPLTDLISGKVEKERFDEAELVKEFKNGNHDAQPPEPEAAPASPPPARLIDRVLQRAVHLHRALAALKRAA